MNLLTLWWNLWQLRAANPATRMKAAETLGRGADRRAVPALLEALPDQHNNTSALRTSIITALGQAGDARAVPALTGMLSSAQALAAVRALGNIGHESAVEALKAVLHSPVRSMREAAITALNQIGSPRGLEALLARLPLEDPVVQKYYLLPAVDRLLSLHPDQVGRVGVHYWIAAENWEKCVSLGAPAVQPLIDELQKGNYNVVAPLGRIGDQRAIQPLVDALHGANELLVTRIVEALVKIGSSQVLAPLSAMLFLSEDNHIRETIAGGLEKLGYQPDQTRAGASYWIARLNWDKCAAVGEPAVEPLIAALERDERLRPGGRLVSEFAARALGQIGSPHAVRALTAKLDHFNRPTSLAASAALAAIGQPAVEGLLEALPSPHNPEHFQMIVRTLGQIHDPRSSVPLSDLLRGEYLPSSRGHFRCNPARKNDRQALVEALGRLGDPAAVEALTIALREHDDQYEPCIWIAASEALARLGEASIPALGEILENKDEPHDVRMRAGETLGKINHPRAQLVFGVYARLKRAIPDREDLVLENISAALHCAEQGRDFEVLFTSLRGHHRDDNPDDNRVATAQVSVRVTCK
jgi:HEAT repeat protein